MDDELMRLSVDHGSRIIYSRIPFYQTSSSWKWNVLVRHLATVNMFTCHNRVLLYFGLISKVNQRSTKKSEIQKVKKRKIHLKTNLLTFMLYTSSSTTITLYNTLMKNRIKYVVLEKKLYSNLLSFGKSSKNIILSTGQMEGTLLLKNRYHRSG